MLAIAAAVTTGAVVAGVVAGPGVVSCVERGDFNECIGETFFGGAPATADVSEEPEGVVATDDVEVEPAVEEVAQEPVEIAAAVLPSFALVRVEPDGSAVIAGTATPASEVQLFANEALLGSETTEAGGDFVYVTGDPLPTGGVELRLLDVASGEFATTSIVVIVQDDRTSEPLVVASEPGAASEILQGPDAVIATEPEEPAAISEGADEGGELPVEDVIEPEAEPAETTDVAEAEEPAVTPEAPSTDETVTAPDTMKVAQAQEPVANETTSQDVVIEEDTIEATVAEEPVVETPETETPTVQEPVTEEPVVDEPTVLEEPVAAESATTEPEVVEESLPEEDAPAPTVVITPPTIDAVEIDGDRNFFAGGGTNNLAVRLYVDNNPVGTTQVRDGRWLIEAINVLTEVSQRVRVDMLNADGSVAGRAEVDFVLDIPAEAEPVEEPVVVADSPQAVEDEAATAPEQEMPAEQQPAESAPVVEESVEPTVPTMIGTSDGVRTTSGRAIIRRGDNLWTIARRVYGEGLRYTQIYEANANMIRNPDLIYPGQVFDLPGTDMVIGDEP